MIYQKLNRSRVHRFLATTTSTVTTLALLLTTGCSSSESSQSNQAVEASQKNTPEVATKAKTQVLRVGFIGTKASKIPICPEGWAVSKGILNPELQKIGINEVKFFPFQGGPALNESLTTGALDVGIYGDTPALVGKAAGIKAKLINQTQVGINAWLITKKGGPSTVQELKGKKVGAPKATYVHRYLLGLLEQAGLSKDVTVVQMQTTEAEPALARGDIAAYPFPTTSGPLLTAKGYQAIDEAKQHKGLVGSGVTVVTEDFLAQHPEFPKRWNQVRQKAVQEIKANPQGFYQFVDSESGGLPQAVIKASYPLTLYATAAFTDDGLQLLNSTKKFLADQKLLKSDFDIKDWQLTQP